MNFQVKLIKNEQRRAVAPIIATLLMVAISVVGGILIFVFAQGFFKDTSIQSPTLDAIEIWGFNALDVESEDFTLHNDETVNCGAGDVDQRIDDGECFAIFIRNIGANPVIIQELRVFGIKIPLETPGGTVATTVPDKLKYCLVRLKTDGCTGQQIVESGQEMTLIVNNDETNLNGEIKIGRPIIFILETGQGQTFVKQIRAGLSSGI